MTKKAPAFQFYSSDFMVGVMYWSHDLVGKYILLLCWQHQHDVITPEDMSNICKTHVEHIDNKLLSKFEQDEEGNYYNKRLKEVIDNQKAYSESRRQNRKGTKKPTKKTILEKKKNKKDMSNISKTYDSHMEDEDRDKDIVIIFKSLTNNNDELYETLWEFYNMRKDIKKPMSKRAVEMFIKKLSEMTSDQSEQIEILQNSIMNSWQGIFPLKEKREVKKVDIETPDYMKSPQTKKVVDEEKRNELLKKIKGGS